MRYRKIPVEVEAFCFTRDTGKWPWWFTARIRDGSIAAYADHARLNGMRIELGDWVIHDAAGGIHAVNPTHFAATYEAVW
jgi:hypothetical protein